MRTPDFWWRERPTPLASVLGPAGTLYGALTAARMARPGLRLDVPVVCVGNLVAGGAGKTPAAIAIARLLQAEGYNPAFLSRGYGRDRAEPAGGVLQVDPDRHDARRCGDEPLLLARVAPTFVASDRGRSAKTALATGADVLVLDDGFQNPALAKDFSLVVVDAAVAIGNGFCVPAGPLRAPIERQWPFVSLLCVIGDGEPGRALTEQARKAGVPVCIGRLRPDPIALARLRDRKLVAFAGIGRPEKFFATLAEAGLVVVERRRFADHHVYRAQDLDDLRRTARALQATLVTTAKDRVRLPPTFDTEVVPVELVFDDPAIVRAGLAQAIRRSPG